jgi:hypothetical protein
MPDRERHRDSLENLMDRSRTLDDASDRIRGKGPKPGASPAERAADAMALLKSLDTAPHDKRKGQDGTKR